MKKFVLFFLLALIFTFQANTTVRTVSNSNSIRAQYTDVQSAINASSSTAPYDTIYIHNTGTSYGKTSGPGVPGITIDRPVNLIGENWAVDVDNIFFPTDLDFQNCIIQSLKISTLNGFAHQDGGPMYINSISNLIIRKCQLQVLYIKGDNWEIFNNLISSHMVSHIGCSYFYTLFYNTNNVIISNNIFLREINACSIIGKSAGTTQLSTFIYNNLFTTVYGLNSFDGINELIINNNIFFGSNPQVTSLCAFQNNLVYNNSYLETLPYGDNIGSGNLIGDPLFTSVPTDWSFALTNDYRLQSGSPAMNAGTDGTDIGITGGLYPWPQNADGTLDMSGEPVVPQTRSFSISPQIINIGTPVIHINAHAEKK